MLEEPARTIRLAAFLNMAIGALALLSVLLAEKRLAALMSAGTAGLGLVVWGAVDAWAAMAGRVGGTRVLAMFMVLLGVVIGASSFLVREEGLFRPATMLLGIVAIAVSVADAFASPSEERRSRFEPRRPQDRAPPPMP